MARAYFIGGAPRVGKSLLAMRIVRQHSMYATSADSIRYVLRGIVRPVDSPPLFAIQNLGKDESAMTAFLRKHPRQGIKLQNDESAAVWPAINELVTGYLADGQDVLVEGVEILPGFLAEVSYPYRAVFLGNCSRGHPNTIAARAHINSHDWMHGLTKDTVEAWADLVRSFSTFIKTEAKAYDMPYIESHDRNFEQSLASAGRKLLAGG